MCDTSILSPHTTKRDRGADANPSIKTAAYELEAKEIP